MDSFTSLSRSSSIPLSFLILSHFSSCSTSWPFVFLISSLAAKISSSKSRSPILRRSPFKSALSSFASLYFFSNTSRSKNLARISFRRVEPSLMKESESSCDAIDVKRKSSMVPKCLRIAASVFILVVSLRLWFSLITGSK